MPRPPLLRNQSCRQIKVFTYGNRLMILDTVVWCDGKRFTRRQQGQGRWTSCNYLPTLLLASKVPVPLLAVVGLFTTTNQLRRIVDFVVRIIRMLLARQNKIELNLPTYRPDGESIQQGAFHTLFLRCLKLKNRASSMTRSHGKRVAFAE